MAAIQQNYFDVTNDPGGNGQEVAGYRQQILEFQQGDGALFPPGSAPYNDRLANILAALKQDHVVTIRCLEQFLCTGRARLLIIVFDNCPPVLSSSQKSILVPTESRGIFPPVWYNGSHVKIGTSA